MSSRLERGPTSVGPLVAWRSVPRPLAVLLLASTAACATAGPSPGPGEPGPAGPGPADPAPAPADAAERARTALEDVRSVLAAGDAGRAAAAADSLYFSVRGRPALEDVAARALWLEARALERGGDPAAAAVRLQELLGVYPEAEDADRAVRSLAHLQRLRLDDPAAARTLLSHPEAVDDSARALLRSAAGSMSVAELEALLDGLPAAGGPADELRAVAWAELAAARAIAGRPGDARRAAERALGADPRDPDRRRAQAVLDGRVAPEEGPVRIGLLVPTSGRFEAVGRWVRQGAELALQAHAASGGRAVELVTADTTAGPSVADRMRRLASEGVAAVLGPLRSGELEAAAGAPASANLPLMSPLAARVPPGPTTFSLWDRERRELDAAGALGRWVGGEVRPGPVGALYPDDELSRRSFLRFQRALAGEGAWMVAAESYDPDATTLEGPVSAVSAFEPRAVFAGASGSASVLQMAPQLSYYGIRGALVAGGADWGDPSTIRRLDPSFSQFRVVAAYADRREGSGAWSRFRSAFEQTYRSSLGDNVVPALGHDAALLLARAVESTAPVRPRALARALAGLEGVEGATGRLRVVPGGAVARRVRLRAVQERDLTPTSAAEARSWLASAGRLETARARSRRNRALDAVREAAIPLTTPSESSEEETSR